MRALAICEKVFGPQHPRSAQVLHNLARHHALDGKPAQAEPLYLRALDIREKTLGRDHPDVAQTLRGLVSVYQAQNRPAEANVMQLRLLLVSPDRAPGEPAPKTK